MFFNKFVIESENGYFSFQLALKRIVTPLNLYALYKKNSYYVYMYCYNCNRKLYVNMVFFAVSGSQIFRFFGCE